MYIKLIRYKKIIYDIVFNIIASIIPTFVLQIILLPLLAANTKEDLYGLILSIISIITVVAGSLGNALNNIRLVKNENYISYRAEGDFGPILIAESIGASIVTAYLTRKYIFDRTELFLIILLTILWTGREYLIVAFRLKLNFKSIMLNNLLLVIGYFLGYAVFKLTGYWEYIYIIGIIFSIGYIITHSSIIKERFVITPLFKNTITELIFLIFAAVINNLLNYADRIILYPLIGGAAVSIYYVSTLFGKLISMLISPLNSVVLSYLSQVNKFNKRAFLNALLSSVIVACLGYIMCLVMADPILHLLYPQWVEKSIRYIPITTVTAMITMMTGMLSPFILRFCAMKWQVIINGISLCIYILASVALFQKFELFGFCLGILCSHLAKFLIISLLGIRISK